jgi:hypothetical protein
MLELMRQIRRLILNLFKLAREVRVLAYECLNVMLARQARCFA